MVNLEPDPEEVCNRAITVYGQHGTVPRGGTEDQPVELFVGNAGTAARFLAAMLCLGSGVYRLHGTPRMHERPQAALFDALRQLGYRVDSPNNKLPALIHGGGPRPGKCTVSIEQSSQFASGLLLCSAAGNWQVGISGDNVEESSYVRMTKSLIRIFPLARGGKFRIELDASSGSYFVAAESMLQDQPVKFGVWATPRLEKTLEGSRWLSKHGLPALTESEVRTLYERLNIKEIRVPRWPTSGWQIDAALPRYVPLPDQISRQLDLGDSIMTAIVVAPWADHPVKFTDLGRLRLQECERVVALRTELTKCGAKVIETGDTLEVFPSKVHGAEIETYNDHRMAMCFAILGLKVPGIRLKNPACVKKTFPNFFQKLAAPPPHGLGVTILHGETRQPLAHQDLFADS